jgi:hypothetical protein
LGDLNNLKASRISAGCPYIKSTTTSGAPFMARSDVIGLHSAEGMSEGEAGTTKSPSFPIR